MTHHIGDDVTARFINDSQDYVPQSGSQFLETRRSLIQKGDESANFNKLGLKVYGRGCSIPSNTYSPTPTPLEADGSLGHFYHLGLRWGLSFGGVL